MTSHRRQAVVSSAAYWVGSMLVLVAMSGPITDWPPHPGLTAWRFDEFRLVVNALPPATLGLALLLYTARALEHRKVLVGVASAAFLGSGILLCLIGVFSLDAMELRSRIQGAQESAYLVTVVKLVVQGCVVAVTLFALGVAGAAAYRQGRKTARVAEDGASAGMTVFEPRRRAQAE